MRVGAVIASEVDLLARQQRMFPDLVTPRLTDDTPTFSRQLGAQRAQFARHVPTSPSSVGVHSNIVA